MGGIYISFQRGESKVLLNILILHIETRKFLSNYYKNTFIKNQ